MILCFSDLASAEKSVKKRTQFFSNCKTGTRSSKFVFYGCTFWKHQLGVPKTFYNIGPRIKLFSQMMTKCYDNEMNVFLPFSRLIIPRKKELAALLQVLIICTLRTLAFLKQWAKPGLFCSFSVFLHSSSLPLFSVFCPYLQVFPRQFPQKVRSRWHRLHRKEWHGDH